MDVLTILATAAEEAHGSDTPFLVVGGVLAVFAIVVGAMGIARHTMSDGFANAIMGVGTLLVVGTMVSVVVS